MERKLYFGIMTPGALFTIIFGVWLISFNFPYYIKAPWMHLKLTLVFLLLIYHLYLGMLLKSFRTNKNKHTHKFYRYINEIPVLFLAAIIVLVVVKPF